MMAAASLEKESVCMLLPTLAFSHFLLDPFHLKTHVFLSSFSSMKRRFLKMHSKVKTLFSHCIVGEENV